MLPPSNGGSRAKNDATEKESAAAASAVEVSEEDIDLDALMAGVDFDEAEILNNATSAHAAAEEGHRQPPAVASSSLKDAVAATIATTTTTVSAAAVAVTATPATIPLQQKQSADTPVDHANSANSANNANNANGANQLAEMEQLRQQLNRAQSRIKSLETRAKETTKEKDDLRSNLVASMNRPPDAAMVQQVADLQNKVERLTSSVTFKEQELHDTDAKRLKFQKRLGTVEKELVQAKAETRAASSKRAHSDNDAPSFRVGGSTAATCSNVGGRGNGSTGSSVGVVQAVFRSISSALAAEMPGRAGGIAGAAAANSAAHTTVAIQSLLESADGQRNGLSILPVLLGVLEKKEKTTTKKKRAVATTGFGGAAAVDGGEEDAGVPPEPVTSDVVSALYTARELVTSSSSFRAAMLVSSVSGRFGNAAHANHASAGNAAAAAAAVPLGRRAGAAAMPPAMREVDDWTPHAHATDVVAAVAADVVRFWAALFESLDRAASAGTVAAAAATAASASSPTSAATSSGTAAAGSAENGGGAGSSSTTVSGGSATASMTSSGMGGGGTAAAAAANAQAIQAWAAVAHVLSILKALACDCPQHGGDLFRPLFGAKSLTLCVQSGQCTVVLAVATLLKTVATLPPTTSWVQSDEGELALRLMLRHLSDTSIVPEAVALRRALVQLLSNLAAVGGPLRMGEVISSVACSNEVITRLCMMVDVQFGLMGTREDRSAAAADAARANNGRAIRQHVHESILFEGLSLFFALLNSPIPTFLDQAKHPNRKNKICTTITKLHRLAHAAVPRWGLEAFADEVADVADHFQLMSQPKKASNDY